MGAEVHEEAGRCRHREGRPPEVAQVEQRTVGEFRYVGLFKRERGTRFAALDSCIYTPLCALLAAAVLYLAAI